MQNWNITINGGQNQFAHTIYNGHKIDEFDSKLIQLINDEVPDQSSKEKLIDDLLQLKSNEELTPMEKDEKKSRIQQFIDTGLSEAAKLTTKSLFENAPEYLQYINF